jgi:hydrogenase maturation protein HypF
MIDPMPPAAGEHVVRRQARARGIVQGVGFRPFVHRLAHRHGLAGFVYNDDDGVLLELEGVVDAVDACLAALAAEAPAASVIDSVTVADVPVRGDTAFRILESPARSGGTVPISPDLATCRDCWREFADPTDRRYRYPFLNCTQCGPRFTIVLDVPYDRTRTTMRQFRMCVDCQREYDDPTSRRFHAEPNACPLCGPSIAWYAPGREADLARREEALTAALGVIRAGGVIAVKGVGGYHLVCDATNPVAVDLLRARKHRPDKPLAILVADVATLRRFASVSPGAEASLSSAAHPIVLVPHRGETPIAANVAPGVDTIGAMLPSLPLHAMIAAGGPVVCTSGNLSDEPIAWRDEDARARLAVLVDGVLAHDRPIEVPCDDSVVQIGSDDRERPVRRSRGYAPFPLAVPVGAWRSDAVLAVGAELKATIGVLQGRRCFLSSHIGDVASPETLAAMSHAVAHMERLHAARPDRIACDLHPGYLSAAWAQREATARVLPLVRVQHHHAHLASLMAEHGLGAEESLFAFTFDGTGYGPDHTIWGGEALLGGYQRFTRVASITPFLLAGGDAAVKQTWRAALGLLHALRIPLDEAVHLDQALDEAQKRTVAVQLARGLGCATTTSMGRLLDACAALAGGRRVVTYEGQGAIEFEAAAQGALAREAVVSRRSTPAATGMDIDAGRYRMRVGVIPDGGTEAPRIIMDPAPLVRALLEDMRVAGRPGAPARGQIALAVHRGIAAAMVEVARHVRAAHGTTRVGLTGGVFQNRLLSDLARHALVTDGFTVLEHHVVPSNDGGLALGQALIAACVEDPTAGVPS